MDEDREESRGSGGGSESLKKYLKEISRLPRVTPLQERELGSKIQNGDAEALRRLVEANLRFVVSYAKRYRGCGLSFLDLINEGNIGLIEAAHRYDATKGTKFITYAIWWIRKSILKALSEHSNLVRVPNYQMKKVREIRDAENSLRRSLGRPPKREEISERLSRSVTKIDQVLQFSLREVSLDEKIGKDRDKPISDYLVDQNCSSPEDDLIKRESNGLVGEAMAFLTDQERTVVAYRFGLAGGPPLTLKEIGERMGISRERVRQIECQAKSRLRKLFARNRIVKAPSKRPFPLNRVGKRARLSH
jgi:RNA polymerase primary sigma factor